jgi:hypothetical protein
MVAPHVTGAAALYKAQFSDATPAEVISNITSSSTLPDTLCEGGPREYFTGVPLCNSKGLESLSGFTRLSSIYLSIFVFFLENVFKRIHLIFFSIDI